jgi:hypothetical protein
MGDELVDSVTPLFAIRLVRQITPGCARVFSRIYSVRWEEAPKAVLSEKFDLLLKELSQFDSNLREF